jgi:SAM-dependent methyltransferase
LITQQIKHFRALNKWFKTPLGATVGLEFARDLKKSNDFVRGEILVQLGSCGTNEWLNHLYFQHTWIASPFSLKDNKHLECSLNQLPFPRNSVDCIIAPLTLESFPNSITLLDEIDRVLKPMGHVVFLGINPWSIWGAAVKCGFLNCYNDRTIKMRSPIYLNRTFTQRGYRQCLLSNMCYFLPINKQLVINKLLFLDEVGKMIWPLPSGVYCYIAQKYELIHPSLIKQPINQIIPAGLHPVIG